MKQPQKTKKSPADCGYQKDPEDNVLTKVLGRAQHRETTDHLYLEKHSPYYDFNNQGKGGHYSDEMYE